MLKIVAVGADELLPLADDCGNEGEKSRHVLVGVEGTAMTVLHERYHAMLTIGP